MSNFAFLKSEWPLLFEAATQAKGMANTDARASCFYSRRALELTVAWLYTYDKTLKPVGRVSPHLGVTRQQSDAATEDVGLRCANPTYTFDTLFATLQHRAFRGEL